MSMQILAASMLTAKITTFAVSTIRQTHASCSDKPLPFSDMWVLVLQMAVRPDEGLSREDYLVPGLLELLQQFFWARREDHVIAAEHPRKRLKKALHCKCYDQDIIQKQNCWPQMQYSFIVMKKTQQSYRQGKSQWENHKKPQLSHITHRHYVPSGATYKTLIYFKYY